MTWFFVSDLHGRIERYRALLAAVERQRPAAVLLGGDLLPPMGLVMATGDPAYHDFAEGLLAAEFRRLRATLGSEYPRVLLILGNDDPRAEQEPLERLAADGLWECVHARKAVVEGVTVYGYSCIPPSPFQLKDWERYDVSRFVDPGCVSPEDGYRTVPISAGDARHRTIQEDLENLAAGDDLSAAVFLFHVPPYNTDLDRAALDGQMVDHVPLDVHVGSIAVRRFIEKRQPLLTLHGHVHESARLTGSWRDRLGATHCLSAAHDGEELALVQVDPLDPKAAFRDLC